MSAAERTAYRKNVKVGQVGLRFKPQPPLNKGRRAQQASAAAAAATTRKPTKARAKTARGADTRSDIAGVKFSG